MNAKPEECTIDMPFTPQDESVNYKLSKTFANNNRCPSVSSSLSSNYADICRICHCEGGPDLPLITPCYCSGSLRYVHQTCLQQWIKSSNIRCCELCKFQFIMQTKVKPFNEWEYLEMSGLERKKLACAMLFHIIAMTCVCWSLYVLIDRTLDEVRKGHLEWPFWTKLIVVGIGFMGGIVFMYIQCRAYFVLCKRWKAYNRVIYVQNAPEKSNSQPLRLQTNSDRDNSGPSCSFKTYSEMRKRDNVTEANCIDIKGVRNLRIFFGEENQIRVHRNSSGSENKTITQQQADENTTCVNSKAEMNNHLYGNTSLHIQIGNSDRLCRSTSVSTNENKSFSEAICSSDCKKQEADSTVDKYHNKGDQSVVKLQIKKAEIVIEFGKHNNSEFAKFPTSTARDSCDGVEIANSPKRKFSSEEYLDSEMKYSEKVANEVNESPTSKLLINHRSCKVPFNNFFRERASLKDWRSSEDLLDVKNPVSRF